MTFDSWNMRYVEHDGQLVSWTAEDGQRWHVCTRHYFGHALPNYPVPALFVDSMADLSDRWSTWVDVDAEHGWRW